MTNFAGDTHPALAVERYYSRLVRRHGATPWGVDWTCEPTQRLRFIQLMKIAGRRRRYSLNDLGCGYGALLGFVRERHGDTRVDYCGVDLSTAMIGQARAAGAGDASAAFVVGSVLPRVADLSVASGLFNVQLGFSRAQWQGWIRRTLRQLAGGSRLGFAVNFIAPVARGVEPLPGLYRTRPEPWIRFCERAFGAQVEPVADYGLREFTLLVRLPPSAPPPRSRAAPSRAHTPA
ncbi:methyltransferase domain-containing protein [Caenimonas aquaedulcis]|uniref:Class I SAM-dependent methyltransferase n=1 Tax=Caenimonas aquaedulcis TaxID=2793270 RepID=A0A931H4K5_9BURK|nr:class I SAM-dependent methyltransferase [Caenimonas aquaedulcis]MBG9388510.1 class I SAM-dependent methyltransferase [Caenimonas aquaedulcis]